MRDDPAFNIKFLEVIEKHRVLYDYTMDQYSNRHIQKQTWNEVSKELNEPTLACKEKWKNIRTAFTRYLRQKQKSESGSKLRRSYYLADYLQFLLPYTKSRSDITSQVIEKQEDTNTSFDGIDDDIDFENFPEETPSEEGVFSNDHESNIDDNISITKKTKKYYSKQTDPLAVEYFPSKSSTVKEHEDADLQFLKSILPDMRQMNSRQKFQFKMGTMKLIGDILYNTSELETHKDHSQIVSN